MEELLVEVNKKEKSITVYTSYDFSTFEVDRFGKYFHINFKKNEPEEMGMALFYKEFGGKKYYPTEINLEEIDCEKRMIILTYK